MQVTQLRQFNLTNQLLLQLYVVRHLILLLLKAVLLQLKLLLLLVMLVFLSSFLKKS